MAEFKGEPAQLAKALVMGQLLGDSFAKWGKCDAHDIAKVSAIADAVLTAASGPAPVVEAPTVPATGMAILRQGMVPGAVGMGMRPMGAGISLPSMPAPDPHGTHTTIPDVPGHNSPEGTTAPVLDLSQPR